MCFTNDGEDEYDVLKIIIIILKDKMTCSTLIITALTAENHMLYVCAFDHIQMKFVQYISDRFFI